MDSRDVSSLANEGLSRQSKKVGETILRWVGPVALAVAAWAHEKISDHDVMIAQNRVEIVNLKSQNDKVDLHFQRLDEKLDRILERLRSDNGR